jgi:hypothetical protein
MKTPEEYGENFLNIVVEAAKKWRLLAEADGIMPGDLAYNAFIDGFMTGYAMAIWESKTTEEVRPRQAGSKRRKHENT